jgi:hypothetical protein
MSQTEKKVLDSPKTVSQLADIYKVNRKTFKKWLKCKSLQDIEIDKIGNFYSINAISRIIAHIGLPPDE